jgi:hypothetical protein
VKEDLDKSLDLTCRQPLAAAAHQPLQQHQQSSQLLNPMPRMHSTASRGAAAAAVRGCIAAWLSAVLRLLLLGLGVALGQGLWLLLGRLAAGEGCDQQQDVQQLLQNVW